MHTSHTQRFTAEVETNKGKRRKLRSRSAAPKRYWTARTRISRISVRGGRASCLYIYWNSRVPRRDCWQSCSRSAPAPTYVNCKETNPVSPLCYSRPAASLRYFSHYITLFQSSRGKLSHFSHWVFMGFGATRASTVSLYLCMHCLL